MSQFLQIPPRAKTKPCLLRKAFFYTLKKLPVDSIQSHDREAYLDGREKEFIQLLIDKSNGKLRMHGSAEELLENINIFESFPGNNTFFSIPDLYQARTIIYESLKNGDKYIAKSDLLVILQNILLNFFEDCPFLCLLIMIFYLKFREESVTKCVEFVKFDEKVVEDMKIRIKRMMHSGQFPETNNIRNIMKVFSQLSIAGIVNEFEDLCPFMIDENRNAFIRMAVENSINSLSNRNRTFGIALDYMTASSIVKSLDTVINENLEMFSPRREDSKQPITVRVFEDGDQQFVMEEEFKKAIHEECQKTVNIEKTILMNCVLSEYEQKLANIEFIRYPITRAKHRATPIQGPSGNFYTLAIDHFLEILGELILGKSVFQRLSPTNLPQFLQDFQKFGEIFFTTENPYFIQTDGLLEPSFLEESWYDVLKNPIKDVRNAKKDGFTIQNLKNELAHLGLTTNFPEIQEHAEVVYSEVDKRKKERFLRTCDLFDAIEHCQLICVLERLPDFKKFVHNQKGCHRIYGFKCAECDAENSKSQNDEKLSILAKELADLKIAHQKILEENVQKSLEIEKLQQKNLRLSVKNETNEVKIKQLTDNLADSKLSIGDENYSNPCTSNASQNKIQCLICEKSIESGKDQVIRCPLCKRRFHSKCAINWLKEHKECPACNGDLPKL